MISDKCNKSAACEDGKCKRNGDINDGKCSPILNECKIVTYGCTQIIQYL